MICIRCGKEIGDEEIVVQMSGGFEVLYWHRYCYPQEDNEQRESTRRGMENLDKAQWEALRDRANRDGSDSLTPDEFWQLVDGPAVRAAEILDKKAEELQDEESRKDMFRTIAKALRGEE